MKNSKPQARRFSKIQVVLFAALGIVVVLVGLWGWNQIAPRPLGDRLEYLGKEDYGSILGLDYSPYSVYSYGTDMEAEEVVVYFPKAELRYPFDQESGYIEIVLKNRTSGESATLYYYETKDETNKYAKSKQPHIIQITDEDYQLLKNSL